MSFYSHMLRLFCTAFILTALQGVYAQSTVMQATPAGPGDTLLPQNAGNRIEIINANLMHYGTFGNRPIRKLLGDVHLRQDSTDFLCDSSYQYVDSNYIIAFGRVHIQLDPTRSIDGNRLTYDGNTKILRLFDRIVMKDSSVTLKTNRLTYHRVEDYGYYHDGGILYNGDNELHSKRGYYYPGTHQAFFKNDVRVYNPDYTLEADTLGYNTESKIITFLSPTRVYDSLNTIYTEAGYYDTKNDYAFFHQNPYLGDTTYTLYADSIWYDQRNDLGRARSNIVIIQKDSSMTLYGQYGEFKSGTKESFLTDSAYAVQKFDGDTLYLFADTLRGREDTTNGKRIVRAYYHTWFYMAQLQGRMDSLVYFTGDSSFRFFKKPILWADENQLLGDTMLIKMRGSQIDSMSISHGAFIITREDTVGYNQVKGVDMRAKFIQNRISRLWILGNAESWYYTKDEGEKGYLGVNAATSLNMDIWFKENRPKRIKFTGDPKGVFHPLWDVMYQKNQLDGFAWRIEERPERPEGIFPDTVKAFQDMIRPDSVPDSLFQALDSLNVPADSVRGNGGTRSGGAAGTEATSTEPAKPTKDGKVLNPGGARSGAADGGKKGKKSKKKREKKAKKPRRKPGDTQEPAPAPPPAPPAGGTAPAPGGTRSTRSGN